MCYPEAVDDGLAWLAEKSVRIVSESYSCDEATDDGWVQDWYARNQDMLVVRAAGNDGVSGSACDFTLNSLCVGGTLSNGVLWDDSSTVGSNGTNPSGTDREEPDLSAQAVDVEVLKVEFEHLGGANPSEETVTSGTSFSAPAIAGLAAVVSEQCGSVGALDPRFLRAILRNGAWYLNPHGEDYNTPRPGTDHLDGAGVPRSGAVETYCESLMDPNQAAGYGAFPFENSGPVPGEYTEFGDEPPPGDDNEPTLLGLPPGGIAVEGQAFFGLDSLPEGARVRVSIVWDSCPLTTMATAPTSVATDFDLAMYNVTRGEYLFASQSFDDTVEGFDVRIPAGWGGDYQFFVMHGAGDLGCDENGDGTGDGERWAWAIRWWY